MRPGFALTTHRFAAFPLRTAIDTAGEITRPLTRRPILALVAGIFFAAVLAAQAATRFSGIVALHISRAIARFTAILTLHTGKAFAFFSGVIVLRRAGVSVFTGAVVFFYELHRSTNKRYSAADSRRSLRRGRHQERISKWRNHFLR